MTFKKLIGSRESSFSLLTPHHLTITLAPHLYDCSMILKDLFKNRKAVLPDLPLKPYPLPLTLMSDPPPYIREQMDIIFSTFTTESTGTLAFRSGSGQAARFPSVRSRPRSKIDIRRSKPAAFTLRSRYFTLFYAIFCGGRGPPHHPWPYSMLPHVSYVLRSLCLNAQLPSPISSCSQDGSFCSMLNIYGV